MNISENKEMSGLLRAIEKLGMIGAVVAIIVLVGTYFWMASTNLSTESTYLKIGRDLSLALLAGIIPVFILFVFSYALLKEIENYREAERRNNLAEDVSKKVIHSLGTPEADKFFSTKTSESKYIRQAASLLWFVQETGSLLSETYRSEIISFLQGGGKIKVLLASPDNTTASLMAFRNSTLSSSQSFQARSEKFTEHMFEISKSAKSYNNQLEIRYLPYPVSYTMVMADPHSNVKDHCQALVRLAGFKVPYEEKADFPVSFSSSPNTFNVYRNQFESMWSVASKLTLITGKPRSGKSTLMDYLIKLSVRANPYYVLSKEILSDNDERIGFEAITSEFSSARRFANRNEKELYDVDSLIWDDIADEIEISINNGVRLFFVDEIGPMQLRSEKFCSAIKRLIESFEISAYFTVADESVLDSESLGTKIKRNPRGVLKTICPEIREKMKDELSKEVSIRIGEF
ncbi:nucleoside-triphosphatase [Marinobacterium rhizophilum]|uniref:nucleoside-triphosphatase n=1 Tax=Marinobacterium rhizophilum TaxID=420402 RepID=UPI00039EDE5E|nr:nucleoside-triphosphatase [Marinobacterium rhizophilum]